MKNLAENSRFRNFHLIFWAVAGIALFISGYSQSNVVISLTRNIYLMVVGGAITFTLVKIWGKFLPSSFAASWLFFLGAAYVLGTLIIIPINPITYFQLGIPIPDLTWRHIFAGSMNFSMVLVFWAFLIILMFETDFKFPGGQQIHLFQLKSGGMERGLEVENKTGNKVIPIEQISHIKAAADYVEIFLLNGTGYLKKATIQSLLEKLGPKGFLQIHRSIIINTNAIESHEGSSKGAFTLVMETGDRLKASRRYKKEIEEILG